MPQSIFLFRNILCKISKSNKGVVFIETKSRTGNLSDTQKEIIKRISESS